MNTLRKLVRSGPLASRRGRLVAILVIATVAITAMAVQAFDGAYYTTPEEFAQEIDPDGRRWRVGGRVVDGTVVEENGRPVSWVIEGEHGETMRIEYDGVVPDLFTPSRLRRRRGCRRRRRAAASDERDHPPRAGVRDRCR